LLSSIYLKNTPKQKPPKKKETKVQPPHIPISPSKPHATVHIITTATSNSLAREGEGPTKEKPDSWHIPEPSHCPPTEWIPAYVNRKLEKCKRKEDAAILPNILSNGKSWMAEMASTCYHKSFIVFLKDLLISIFDLMLDVFL